ncbi:hypothetical protein WJ0W_005858 [Paenibacillus melissococcoides]|uniref:Uncharacterized protein n=1 Tax=Paenibacillus melissococcoides TaxID=2912268 RepID=A0ABM9GA44_9BACL|nr:MULTISPECIES: hypothetical protein [Paenibacillus]MEB9893962.1 hypothetical protein [Bacillus cereus]CAH8248674.1 hypothetical protein WJ0W_005858 [Paenibacillus melissococcoides]CAH8714064.1 hypothetical protein WDD9_003754 [Paenibacillus melissococcoides]CAH8720168.1 hypothetical protein HTL2_005853 [Paenibacillus melissococcoides]
MAAVKEKEAELNPAQLQLFTPNEAIMSENPANLHLFTEIVSYSSKTAEIAAHLQEFLFLHPSPLEKL